MLATVACASASHSVGDLGCLAGHYSVAARNACVESSNEAAGRSDPSPPASDLDTHPKWWTVHPTELLEHSRSKDSVHNSERSPSTNPEQIPTNRRSAQLVTTDCNHSCSPQVFHQGCAAHCWPTAVFCQQRDGQQMFSNNVTSY